MELLSTCISPWQLTAIILTLYLLYFTITCLQTRYSPGLRSIPGPFLASISNLDRILSCYRGHQMLYHISLHRQYGPLVRIGPNHISFSDPALIPQIYSITSKFYKSDFYTMFDIKTAEGPMPTIFSVRDEGVHRAFKKPVAGAYAMSALRELEPVNDECSEIFMRKMEERVGGVVDLGVWVHWYAWDTIMSITFSNRLGFMENERDMHNIIAAINGRLKYNSIIGQVPYLHKYLFGNDLVAYLASFIPSIAILNSSKYIVAFTQAQLARYQSPEKESNLTSLACPDLLARFKRTTSSGETTMTPSELLSHTSGNIFAGSDTTAASLRSVFYHLLRHPRVLTTLLAELDAADSHGALSDPITFAESQSLPYLQAVIKESLRMHPAVGLLLERVVPSAAGPLPDAIASLPPGTVIGMNPWVAARSTEIYGSDADAFRPERWLDADGEVLKGMERGFLAFGAGARTCLGRNVSLLEMSKLVPQVLRRFTFELVEPEREWTMEDYWFVQQRGLICRVRKRGQRG